MSHGPTHHHSVSDIGQRRLILTLTALFWLATFSTYLGVGIYYVTGPMSPFKTLTLSQKGDSFLAVFPGWNNKIEFDDAAYNRAASEIIQHGIPRDRSGAVFFYAPVYAYFVAACYSIGGLRLLAIAVPQALLAACTCVALGISAYRIAGRFRFSALVITSLLFLINLRLAMYVGYVSPTILLAFFFALALLAASGGRTNGNLVLFASALILGMGTQAGFFIIALGATCWLLGQFFLTKHNRLLIAALIILAFAVGKLLLPTFFRQNSADSMNKIGQSVLWEANNPYYDTMGAFSLWERRPGNPWSSWKMSAEETRRYEGYLERTKDDKLHAALLWIRENPSQYARLAFVRLWTGLGPFTAMMSPRNRLISLAVWLIIFPAGAYGWWLSRRTPMSRLATIVFFVVIVSGALVIVEWYLRYRFPLDLLLTMYAGVGYTDILMFRLRRTPRVLGVYR